MSTPSSTQIDRLGAAIGQPGDSATQAASGEGAPRSQRATGKGSASAGHEGGRGHARQGDTAQGDTHDEGGAGGAETRTAEPERPMPPNIRRMPELIQDLWRRDVQFNIDSKSGDFLLEGFYTNGPLRLAEENEGMVAVDKRGRREEVSSFEDIARINFRWWKLSTDKDRYIVPQRPWIDAFTQNKWVSRKVIYVPAEDTGDGNIPS